MIKTANVRLTSITHNIIPVLGRVSLKVFLSCKRFYNHNFYVIPDVYLRVPVLMGADLIGRGKFVWEASQSIISWSGTTYQVKEATSDMCRSVEIVMSSFEEKIVLQARQKIVLVPNEISLCKFTGLEQNNIYIVGKFQGKATRDINMVKAGIFRTNGEGNLQIPMWTKRKNPHLIRPGAALITVIPVSNEEIVYCNRLGDPIGTPEQVKEQVKAGNLTICNWHKEIIHLDNINAKDENCVMCVFSGSINQVRIQNDMLPHFDHASGKNRNDRLKVLIEQLDLNHLDISQKDILEKILLKFNSLFVLDSSELGCIIGPEEHIPMVDNTPVRAPMYRHPEQAKAIIAEMIEEMLSKGVIENSSALYLAPIVLVNKGSGKKRMCIDYRKVNEHIKQDIYPLPRLDSLVEEVAGYKYYCTLDLKDAYYQVRLDSETRDITTFSDGIGLYRFTRLPFGLSVSPAIFTRAMQKVLEPLVKKGWVRNYLDDVVIFAQNYEELMDRLSLVLERFLEMGLKLNVSKCEFAQSEIKFLGHRISAAGMKPDPSNIEKVLAMNPPQTAKQVRRFIGMVGFYRKFIPGFSKIASPLTDLTKKDVKFVWNNVTQEAFEILKSKLVEEPILVKFDPSKEQELHTDASKYHVGAVLLQKEEEGLKSVGYYSKKLNKTEQKYSTTDKEALAIVQGCRFFHHYLWARKFKVVTDHQPLMNIFKQKTKCQRMSRYMLEMRDYNFKIVYQPGIVHRVPDALSRPVVAQLEVDQLEVEEIENERARLGDISLIQLKQAQREDPQWKKVIEYLEKGPLPKKIPGNRPIVNFHLIDDILYINKGEVDRQIYCIVVPESLIKVACEVSHVDGHFGERKSIQRAQRLFYWPRLWMDVKKYVKSCPRCQQYNSHGGLVRKWKELPAVEEKGERVSIDLMDMYNGINGYRYCMSVMDHFSRFLRAYPLRRKTKEEVVKILQKDFSIFGNPKILVMDNGLEFRNIDVKTVCKDLRIGQAFCMPYHPQGNSVSERVHRTLKTTLSKMNDKHPNKWPEYLQDCVRIINESVHGSLGTTPFFAHFGFHPLRTFGEIVLPSGSNNSSPEVIKNLIRNTLIEQTRKYLDNANKKRNNDRVSLGEWVWIRNETPVPGTATKLNPHWIGPYKVIKVLAQDKGYQVEDPFTGEKLERGSERIKKCYIGNEIIVQPHQVPQVPDITDWAIRDRPRRVIRPPIRYVP